MMALIEKWKTCFDQIGYTVAVLKIRYDQPQTINC